MTRATVEQLRPAIGATVLVRMMQVFSRNGDDPTDFLVSCRVLDRMDMRCYMGGGVRLLVTPLCGRGQAWVELSRIVATETVPDADAPLGQRAVCG